MAEDCAVTAKHKYHGGLQFNGDAEGALRRFCHTVSATLEDYGHLVERKTLTSKTEASIVSSHYLVRLHLETTHDEANDRYGRLDRAAGLKTMARPAVSRPKHRLAISITPVSELLDDSEISELILVVMLYRMVDICSTQRVEWLSPNTVLTIEQFLSTFDSFTPRKPRERKQIFESVTGQFAGIDIADQEEFDLESAATRTSGRPIKLTDDQLLSIAFRTDNEPVPEVDQPESEAPDDERPSDILRLTSWGMTGAVASFSAPIALSMAAVNLIRGEDFRLNTQVLVFTVAIVALNASNAFADVANALGM
ncbi:hypothetical protein E1297_47235 [Roseibium sp. RKSG952]|nr:hypothetical protein [Roseibium sp. RKSG952]